MATKRPPTPTVLDLMSLIGWPFTGESWNAWRAILRGLFALPMAAEELDTFRALTGRTEAPIAPARELWAICGRRAGKSLIAALIAVYLAACRSYRLAPGERGVVMLLAADRRQARVVRRYVGGLLESTPALAQLVLGKPTRESIDLTTGITIEIHTTSFRTVRGYTVVGAICDEIAFWPTDDAAEPDAEILAALRPAMATVPEALLLCLSSPYARRGELWTAHRDHFGRDHDPVLVIQAETRQLNQTVPPAIIEQALADDQARAASEYLAQFRADIEGFLTHEALRRVVVPDRLELLPREGVNYHAFVDPSGGSADSMTLAIAHAETQDGQEVRVLDCLREVTPPFSPAAVVEEFVSLLRSYRVSTVTGDRYAGEWPREQFRDRAVDYQLAPKPKSDLYRDALPLVNSGRVELLDNLRLQRQLVTLERRTARGGRDSIDHPPGGHDDLANAALGALVTLQPSGSGFRIMKLRQHPPWAVGR